MIETNSLIRASAGTGKTFALATRFIRLMMFDKVDAKSIVALTFSRAAAHEIHAKILTRLSAAAKDEAGAEKEWQLLLEDYRAAAELGEAKGIPDAAARYEAILQCGIPHEAKDFQRLLRQLVDTQHVGTIATIDSFILRIVQNFPLEMGFQNAVEVLDPIDEDQAVEEAVRRALSGEDEKGRTIGESFKTVRGNEFSRTCLQHISRILNDEGWRRFVVEHPECRAWTVEGMCAALGVPLASACPDLSGLPFNRVARANAVSPEEAFVRHVRTYESERSPIDASASVCALMRHFWENPTATAYDYVFYRKPYRFDCGADGAAAVRAAIAHMVALHLKRQVEIVRAKIRLAEVVEDCYHRLTRRSGKLTFEDFTKYPSHGELTRRGVGIRNVEFRFDSTFAHWALDEFQDTSVLQWKCLSELVENAANEGALGEARSAMVVGDFKQSIYTWRGASAAPFVEVSAWPAFQGCSRDLRQSRRYGPHITAFVNRVFGAENVRVGDVIPSFCRDAVDEWNRGWMEHVSDEPEDYVKVIGARAEDGDEAEDGILPALYEEVRELYHRRMAAGSPDEIGILVRSNDRGLEVAEYLRERNLPVVWEGVNPVHDQPIVQAVLALLRLAEHPEDVAAWRTANDLFGVRERLLPDCTSAAAVSEHVARQLARQGLARTLKDFCGGLRGGERLGLLVERGVAFELRPSGGGSVDEFVKFLERAQTRDRATSSGTIRILTIHRSKGLGVDHLLVPLFETRGRSTLFANKSALLYEEGADWVLPHLSSGCEQFNDETRRVAGAMRNSRLTEALRTYYVALTRAKKSMFVIFPDDRDKRKAGDESNLLMRDLIAAAVGGNLPFEEGTYPTFASKSADGDKPKKDSAGPVTPFPSTGPCQVIERRSPSKLAHWGGAEAHPKAVASLFAAGYGSAARRGIEAHAAYQAIVWADPETAARLPEGFRPAFVRPSDDATVWRERAYERQVDGTCWETGQFDRVVFVGTGRDRSATIYDFKTNAREPGESAADFAARLCALYRPQMERYRQALSQLTGIPLTRIGAQLLLEASGQAVSV